MTLPAVDTVATYGGVLNDYAPVEDPTTDRPGTGANQAYGSTAAATHTLVRAWVRFIGTAGSSVSLAASNAHDAVWGSSSGVTPVVSHTAGTGIFDITWPVTITDEIGNTQSVSLRAPAFIIIEGSTHGFSTLTITGANTARVRLANTAGAANDFVGLTICAGVI